MKSLKTYIIESTKTDFGGDTGTNLFLLTNSYKGYKVWNLFDPEKQKDSLTDVLKSIGIKNNMFRADYDIELPSYSFSSLADPLSSEKNGLPSEFIIGLGSGCEVMKLKYSKYDDNTVMVMVLKKEKTILVLPPIDIQGGEPRTWVYRDLFKDEDDELSDIIGSDTVYDLHNLFNKYYGKSYNGTNMPVYITMDEWYNIHASK